MVRVARILCPVDVSETSAHAFDHALALARVYDAQLTVLRVSWAGLPPIAYPIGATMPAPVPLAPAEFEVLRDELRHFTERGSSASVKMDFAVREGPVVPMILEEARAIGADLIVMGTHGRSGFDRLILGSVTERVLRKAGCAVMTVPPSDRTAVPARGTRTIVCGVDFSPASLAALDYALSIAQEFMAMLLLVHVVDWPPDRPLLNDVGFETEAFLAKVQEGTRSKLRTLVPAEARAWCQPEELVTLGRPYEEIVRLARERDADLIVMGVHGRSTLDLALFGSTTHQVVRHATCPVITVRG